ncbi:unnamed protein product, partial [Meganyctiphanes norvegica]
VHTQASFGAAVEIFSHNYIFYSLLLDGIFMLSIHEMDIPECSICTEGLDDSERRPRCLPCGHTICTMCIDKSITRGDRTCPSCRQLHHVTAATELPINFFSEEMFQKLAEKSSEISRLNSEMCDDDREMKENIIKFVGSISPLWDVKLIC